MSRQLWRKGGGKGWKCEEKSVQNCHKLSLDRLFGRWGFDATYLRCSNAKSIEYADMAYPIWGRKRGAKPQDCPLRWVSCNDYNEPKSRKGQKKYEKLYESWVVFHRNWWELGQSWVFFTVFCDFWKRAVALLVRKLRSHRGHREAKPQPRWNRRWTPINADFLATKKLKKHKEN